MADQTRLIHELHRPIRSAGINAHALSAAHTSANTYYLDELGPVAARSYPRPSRSDGAHRPHFHPAYARYGYRWAFGAVAHRSGLVLIETSASRDTDARLQFLDRPEGIAPAGDAYLIIDALPLHRSVETLL